jgi:dsDNA-specific endonuclease/ATPase MutS2
VQLRAEMRDEFSAIRQAIQIGDEGGQRSLREEIRAGDEETRRALREEIRNGNVMIATALTEQIGDARTESRSLFEDARRENRVLIEEALARIANIQEGLSATQRTKKR